MQMVRFIIIIDLSGQVLFIFLVAVFVRVSGRLEIFLNRAFMGGAGFCTVQDILRSGMNLLPKEYIADLMVYEPGRPIEEVARELGFTDIAGFLKLASNENELGPSPKALEAMRAAAPEMHRYPDGGCFYLKEKLAKQLDVAPENLLFGCGSNELIVFLCHVFLNRETNLVMSDKAFAVYFLAAALFESGVIRVPTDEGFGHDLDGMLAAITPETRIVAICNPNNPTGTLLDQAAIDRFMDRVPDHVLTVFDEAYFELVPEERKPDVLKYVKAGRENVVVLRTFSKAYGLAGLRIGYAVGQPEVIGLLNRVRQPFNVNAMAQAAAMAALDDSEFIEETRETVMAGLEQFSGAFAEMGLEYVPSVCNFILVKTGNGRDVCGALQKRKVIARPMAPYGMPEWIRISTGTAAQNSVCIRELQAVLNER